MAISVKYSANTTVFPQAVIEKIRLQAKRGDKVKKLKPRSVKMQSQLIWMTFLLIISILIFITAAITNQASKAIGEVTEGYVSEALNQLIKRHDMILNNYLSVTNSIVTNPVVQRALASLDSKSEIESLPDRQFIIDLLSTIGSENKGILALRVESALRNEFTYGSVNLQCANNIDFAPYLQKAKQKRGKFLWVKVITNCNYPMLLGMRDIVRFSQIDQSLGTLYILLDWNLHRHLFENTVFLQDGANLLVTNTEGETVVFSGHPLAEESVPWLRHNDWDPFGVRKQGVFELEMDGNVHIVTYRTSEESGWKFISLIPKNHLLQGIQRIRAFSIQIGLIALGIAFGISVLFARKITRPVKQLVQAMIVVENTNVSIKLSKSKYFPVLEMEILKEKFEGMSQRIRDLIKENYVGKINEQEARLQALQSQINPHFLYNTLDSLYWMLVQKDEKQVSGMILALSDCLRYAISKPLQTVKLSQELKYIGQYVDIQSSRFGGKIKLHINIPDSMMAYTILKLMLQPLVENAIIHGLGPLDHGGTIEIKGKETEDFLVIEVEDNGIGMAPERKEMLLKGEGGVGLRNVERRIKLTYGERYGVRIQSEHYVGTIVTILLPKQMKTLPNELI
jgi:two-component system sensor histidine kinase YesM